MYWMVGFFFLTVTRVQFPIRWLKGLHVVSSDPREAIKYADLGDNYSR